MIGALANIMLAAVKGIAGVLGNSYALIADAMESTLDVVGSIVVWSGLRIAMTPPDDDHPYGHGKAEPLAAIVVALGLIAAAVGIAIESIREIHTPHHAPRAFTLVVLAAVVIVKETLFRLVLTVGTEVRSTASKSDAWHHRSDALTSCAAFIGISTALIGGKGYEMADDWAALFACIIIAYNGCRLIRPALAEVMDAALWSDVEEHVREIAIGVDGVKGLDICTVRKMGLDFFVDLHVEVDGGISVRQGHDVAHRVKDSVRAANPAIRDVLIHIEPIGESPKKGGTPQI
ncbi:MAG: cation transporter [Candidatus Hydrogenedentes bacterium]|nr:cation transporter [Candidatus Hydrogenedentota bacterium]